jgi:hypothetical protein
MTVLNIKKIVKIVVLVNKPADCEVGLVKLIILSTIKPNKKLVIPEVAIIAY